MKGRDSHGTGARSNWRDRLEYRLVLALCFILYLVAAIPQRLLSRLFGQHADRDERQQSLLAEARSAAHAAAGYAYMA